MPQKVQLLAVDTSATMTMKNAAKRDINCELQYSVNHRNFERTAASGFHPWLCLFEYRTQSPALSQGYRWELLSLDGIS